MRNGHVEPQLVITSADAGVLYPDLRAPIAANRSATPGDPNGSFSATGAQIWRRTPRLQPNLSAGQSRIGDRGNLRKATSDLEVMGHNDHLDEDRPALPHNAGTSRPSGFEPDDEWLTTAEPELQHEAMRLWFVTRYWDPANDTPYNSDEGGYLYIHGGPYDAGEELYSRFGDLFSEDEELITAVIEDVESDGITEWAPIQTAPDYDSDFDLEPAERDNPHLFFCQRVNEIDALVDGAIDDPLKPFLRTLVYSSLIAALEAYLADTTSYWVGTDKEVFRKFVVSCEEFKQQKLTLSQIFERMDALKQEVETYLQQLVWHRLDKVAPLIAQSLTIETPEIGPLMKQIVVRHDIVHRGGKTREGKTVEIGSAELSNLRNNVTAFVNDIETKLKARFPIDLSGLVGNDDLVGFDATE